MNGYKYQLHCHTASCSGCARTTPAELVHALVAGGYSGVVMTNHFFGGNTTIDRDLPWDKFVDAYVEDWQECKNLAEPYDLDILFGVEECIGGGKEVLCYGLTPEMLYDHPELRGAGLETYYKVLSPLGVVIIQPHPFIERDYIQEPGVHPLEFIDGIEVHNSGKNDKYNEMAESFAEEHPDLIRTSGGDAHSPDNCCKGGIISPVRIDSPEKLVEVLKSRDYTLIKR